MFLKLQANDIALPTLENSMDERNPGKIVDKTKSTMQEVFVKSSKHNFVTKFSPGAFLHFPLFPPEKWWEFVAVAYDEITLVL